MTSKRQRETREKHTLPYEHVATVYWFVSRIINRPFFDFCFSSPWSSLESYVLCFSARPQVAHLMHALEFSLSPSLPMLYCCSWKVMWLFSTELEQTLISLQELNPKQWWNGTTSLLFQVSIDMARRQGVDPFRAFTHRTSDSAKLGIPKVHRYSQTLCNTLLSWCSNLCQCCCVTCYFVSRDKCVFINLSHSVQCTFPAWSNTYQVDWWHCFSR